MTLVAIDPGCAANGPGCALAEFNAKRLTRVYFQRAETAAFTNSTILYDSVVWECPQCDARSRTIAPTLIELAAAGALMAGLCAQGHGETVRSVTPSEWKGSTAKPVHHGRIWIELDLVEKILLGGDATLAKIEDAKRKGALDRWSKAGASYYPRGWHTHNLLDAVGIGLWALGRTAR